MKLSTLEALPSFALLGPGFGAGWRLVAPLREAPAGRIAFLPYEAAAAAARRFDGDEQRLDGVELDVEAPWVEPLLDDASHSQGVEAIRAAIAAGDVYQVNLTLRAKLGQMRGSALFAALCRRGVPRFAAWVRFPDGRELASASPELFFSTEAQTIRCQPMKGTASAEAALAVSSKDKAELAIITDLIRNELTMICEPRSVRVTHARRLLELGYAVQAVSDVEGRLRPDVGLTEILTALHPGGSITGAPKSAARRMIACLEPTPRGAYCGALGCIDGTRATFSLLIRTAEHAPDGSWIYGTGGGIGWDSSAAAELDEARLKLGALR